MKSIQVTILALALGTIPAWAGAQQQQDPEQQQQQEQQMGQQQEEQAQEQKFLREARIDGKVRQVNEDSLTLGVAGTEIELQADEEHLRDLQEGDVVETTAIPLPEAQDVRLMDEVDPQERQQLEQQPLESVVPGEENALNDNDNNDNNDRETVIPGQEQEKDQQEQDQQRQQDGDRNGEDEALLPGQQQQKQDQQHQQDGDRNGEDEAVIPGQQQNQAQQQQYFLQGTISDIQENIIQLETEQHGELSLQIDPQQAEELQEGQEYMIQLSELPDEARQWKARDIQQL